MKKTIAKKERQLRRKIRVRATIFGTNERPRLSVYRSLKAVYAQIIDDSAGKTLVAVRSSDKLSGDVGERKGKVAEAYLVGKSLAEKAKAASITKVVFDRSKNRYHGRIQAIAEGARDGGLQF